MEKKTKKQTNTKLQTQNRRVFVRLKLDDDVAHAGLKKRKHHQRHTDDKKKNKKTFHENRVQLGQMTAIWSLDSA